MLFFSDHLNVGMITLVLDTWWYYLWDTAEWAKIISFSLLLDWWPASDGQSEGREGAAVRMPLTWFNVPLLSLPLLSKEDSLPDDGETISHCIISATCTNSCCYSWPGKVKYSSILKRHATTNKASLSENVDTVHSESSLIPKWNKNEMHTSIHNNSIAKQKQVFINCC
jgi:hypothetical protein